MIKSLTFLFLDSCLTEDLDSPRSSSRKLNIVSYKETGDVISNDPLFKWWHGKIVPYCVPKGIEFLPQTQIF